jgi:hypothetical protein
MKLENSKVKEKEDIVDHEGVICFRDDEEAEDKDTDLVNVGGV